MEMPFGKYRGFEVEDLPDGYIEWLHDKCEIQSRELEEEVERLYDERIRERVIERQEQEDRWRAEITERAQARREDVMCAFRGGFDRLVDRDPDLFLEVLQAGYGALVLAAGAEEGAEERVQRLERLMQALREYFDDAFTNGE